MKPEITQTTGRFSPDPQWPVFTRPVTVYCSHYVGNGGRHDPCYVAEVPIILWYQIVSRALRISTTACSTLAGYNPFFARVLGTALQISVAGPRKPFSDRNDRFESNILGELPPNVLPALMLSRAKLVRNSTPS